MDWKIFTFLFLFAQVMRGIGRVEGPKWFEDARGDWREFVRQRLVFGVPCIAAYLIAIHVFKD